MKTIKRIFTVLILLVLAIYIVMFILANQHQVMLEPVLWNPLENSLAVWMLLSFVAGVLFTSLFLSVFLIKGSHKKRKVEKELKKTNKKLEQTLKATQLPEANR